MLFSISSRKYNKTRRKTLAEQEAKLEFPIWHDKCPFCGSTRRVANEVKEEEVAKGKIRPETHCALGELAVTIADPSKIVGNLTAPLIIGHYDACAEPECGALYLVHAERREQDLSVDIDLTPKGGKQKPLSPFFGKG